MGSMRRGHPHTVEGEFSRVYQAQSILSALMEGNQTRYDCWIQKHGTDLVMPVSGLDPDHVVAWFLCHECKHVI